MTAQIDDTLVWNRSTYSINAIALENDDDLFDPDKYSLQPEMMHTACYRGYFCTYNILKNNLFLSKLTIRQESDNYPIINGIEPEFNTEFGQVRSEATYSNLMLPIAVSGILRLSKGLIQSRFESMGFQESTSYRTLKQITLKDGKLVGHEDLSAKVSALRKAQQVAEKFKKDNWLNRENGNTY